MRKTGGQTLIIAILMLGVLLILGLAFASVVSSNIREAGASARYSVTWSLSRSGVDMARYQLTTSSQGADWRPEPTPPVALVGAPDQSRDPDAVYLRQGTGLAVAKDPSNPTVTVIDRGGPDFKGPYTREETDKGRILTRLRYSPNDVEGFTTGRDSAFRGPGKAKSYIIIESIGRAGTYQSAGKTDPTKGLSESVRISGFVTGDQVRNEVARMRAQDIRLFPETRKVMALASIGLVDWARYITNKYKANRPAEIGFPVSSTDPNLNSPTEGSGLGVQYSLPSGPINVEVPYVLGDVYTEPAPGRSIAFQNIPGRGSLYSNADLLVHGPIRASLNTFLGDSWNVNGKIRVANSNSHLLVSRTTYDFTGDQWVSGMQGTDANGNPYNIASTVNTPFDMDPGRLESDRPTFSTALGVVRDSAEGTDTEGHPRGVGRKDPPSMLAVDPQTKRNRYYEMTRNSGPSVNGRLLGAFGYGEGVYVNQAERGNLDSEDERRQQGAVRNLPSDWLNPGNSASLGWQGPYYVPIASYVQLLPDGFEIIRDSRSRQRFWRNPDGTSTNSGRCRYRLRKISGVTYILNSVTAPTYAGQPEGSITDNDFIANSLPFNGVLFFEGDVRVRGIIPTDVQLTLVSMGSVYIEGSIVKGTHTSSGVINRPSQSMLMLMARDYVTLNTTMFFGPLVGQSAAVKAGQPLPETPSPVELDPNDATELILNTEFISGPEVTGGNPSSPSTWRPYASNYRDAAFGEYPNLLLSASADDNGPSYVAIDSAPISPASSAPFGTLPISRTLDFGGAGNVVFNSASQWFTAPSASVLLYGLGDPTINAYPKFETIGFPILDNSSTDTARLITAGSGRDYAVNDPTLFRVRLSPIGNAATKNFLMAKAAIVPHDIKIEAAMFAEEGSFFVIPGNWFNTNPEDTRARWLLDVTSTNQDQANLRRYQLFGSGPMAPFYGEPMDVRIRIIGAVSENMPAPMSQQAQWLQKWGWIPSQLGGTGRPIPRSHFGSSATTSNYVPNLTLSYDPALGFASADGLNPLRVNKDGWVLPPMPRLPVSPTLAYFGDANP